MKPAPLTCGRCRSTYDSNGWSDLELLDVIDSDCVQQGLSDWPPDLSIEVRRCTRCRGEIARTVRTGSLFDS
jgi:hypothetical protein